MVPTTSTSGLPSTDGASGTTQDDAAEGRTSASSSIGSADATGDDTPTDLPACMDTTGGAMPECGTCELAAEWQEAPYSELSGEQLSLPSAGPRFTLTTSMLEHVGESGYFFLSRAELEGARDGDGEWNVEYAGIVNGLLDFERCGAHVGNNTWPDGSGWFSFYFRPYVVAEPSHALHERISCLGPALVAQYGADFESVDDMPDIGLWQRTRLRYSVFYSDYGGYANIDFVTRDYCEGTVVLVFMYPDTRFLDPEAEIQAIVASACIALDGEQACCVE